MKRLIIKIYGIVQSVGFRPFVYRQAVTYDIKGNIKNCGDYVCLDIEGEKPAIKKFLLQVIKQPPEHAKINQVNIKYEEPVHYPDFQIVDSRKDQNSHQLISRDLAVCEDCIKDIENRSSRFFQYPFTSCTHCGPRFTLIVHLPYDRKNTTMNEFELCNNCHADYENIDNRRFHAETIACPSCGPQLKILNSDKIEINADLEFVRRALCAGNIIGIKGTGGYHLACDALNEQAIIKLRERKRRPEKPLAVMAKNLELIKAICEVSPKEEEVLCGSQRPIVLLKIKKPLLSPQISKNSYIGFFLPYTPLHYLLFKDSIKYLIMTSMNEHHHPLIYQDEETGMADYYVTHNRKIHMPCDDSVVEVIGHEEMVLRLGRGYTPAIFPLKSQKEILALGADQQNSFAFSKKGMVQISQYIGNLSEYNTLKRYLQLVNYYHDFYDLNADTIATDLNPDYLSNRYAKDKKVKSKEIQHHHAHMVSCMGEYGLNSDVIGVIFDGTGFGPDGKIWGGEFFIGNRKEFQRAGHLEYVVIQGGERAITEISRIALSYLDQYKIDYPVSMDNEKKILILESLKARLNCFETSSMGRLFDCVASLLNLKQTVTYDAEAPQILESLVIQGVEERYPYEIIAGTPSLISLKATLKGIVDDINNQTDIHIISTKFHNSVIHMTLNMVTIISNRTGINKVVLSGGVFQNRYLLENISQGLVRSGLNVYFNHQVPINDNGISYGQLLAALAEGEG